jgi:hypothetical protein
MTVDTSRLYTIARCFCFEAPFYLSEVTWLNGVLGVAERIYLTFLLL